MYYLHSKTHELHKTQKMLPTRQLRQHLLGEAATVMPPPAVQVTEAEKKRALQRTGQVGQTPHTHPQVRGTGAKVHDTSR